MKIQFLGATKTVTGSKYLLSFDQKNVLIDCGLFQGLKEYRLLNWKKFLIDPKKIDAILLTHAHIDHSGYIPLLVKNGFSGPIYATKATKDLCNILLPDSGHIHEEDAKFANKHKFSKHSPAKPLYTVIDAENSLKYFKVIKFGQPYNIIGNLTASWTRVGHILGAASIRCKYENIDIVFSGDLGRKFDPIMRAPKKIQKADYLVLESTYGNRYHSNENVKNKLKEIIVDTAKKGGTVIIPAFSVGRSQNILYYIYKLKEQEKIPNIPVYLDSPLSIKATKLMVKHIKEHKLNYDKSIKVSSIARHITTIEESKSLNNKNIPMIIISASGMATGGRILHHLKSFLPDPKNTVLFVGFQAKGTRGERLLSGCHDIKIHGQIISVRAKIEYLANTSAHADLDELIDWLRSFNATPRKVFITHGEVDAAENLKKVIEEKFGWNCFIPEYGYSENL